MSSSLFSEVLAEIKTAEFVIDPNGNSEPSGNLWTISLSSAQASGLVVDDVADFIRKAAWCFDARRSDSVLGHSMFFYCWVDEQAGQLRFSVVSSLPLPFSCAVNVVDDAETVAQQFLACPFLDGIPIGELKLRDAGEPACDTVHSLDVFVLPLPLVEVG